MVHIVTLQRHARVQEVRRISYSSISHLDTTSAHTASDNSQSNKEHTIEGGQHNEAFTLPPPLHLPYVIRPTPSPVVL